MRIAPAHMPITAMFNGTSEVVAHDFSKEEARTYIKELQYSCPA